MTKSALSKAELRAQLEVALAGYSGTVTHCPPGARPDPEPEQPNFDDDDEEDDAGDSALD